jgi:hypothetical protein
MLKDHEVRALRDHLKWHQESISMTAKNTGLSRATVRKYRHGKLPGDIKIQRKPRQGEPTRPSPFATEHELEIKEMWLFDKQLDGHTLLSHLIGKYPGKYLPGQVRTLQRRIERWSDEVETFRPASFKQEWRPGRVMQLDWTHANELEISIAGTPFPHRFCHAVLPYSNWSWASISHSESLPSLMEGAQAAYCHAGGLTEILQTDNSSAATHRLGKKEAPKAEPSDSKAEPSVKQQEEAKEAKRGFNCGYQKFADALGICPETIPVRCSNANADIETANGHLKHRLDQQLRLRGSRDFPDVASYRLFVEQVLTQRNLEVALAFQEEQRHLRPLPPEPLPVYVVRPVKVSPDGLIHLEKNLYSMPSKLIGDILTLWIYEDKIRVFHPGKGELEPLPHLHGEGGTCIDFRHLITPLRNKPASFRNYIYRHEFFPGTEFRRVYDRLTVRHSQRQAERIYLDLLQLAADEGLAKIDEALRNLFIEGGEASRESVSAKIGLKPRIAPDFDFKPSLNEYDTLIPGDKMTSPAPLASEAAG